MRGILFAILVIAVVGATAFELSRAFFSDAETSTGNTFQAGMIDLKVGNTSYYNGAAYPGPTEGPVTWSPRDITVEKFLNFTDIKPGDWGEDTISLEVNDNDAWACYELTITKDDDNGCTDPEKLADSLCDFQTNNLFDGELGQQVNFILWADDGDNVLEESESTKVLFEGKPSDLPPTLKGALADSTGNAFTGVVNTPLTAGQTYYLGKAWCFGTLTKEPVTGDTGEDPTVNSGIKCDGQNLDNAAQTDILMGDITFSAIQARNNPNYHCDPNYLVAGEAEDPNTPQLGLIQYTGYLKGYEFWFIPIGDVSIYTAGHPYHNFYEVNPLPLTPADWCGTTVVPDRPPYNLVGHTGETVYWKAIDETTNSKDCN
jgi:hypothetical protein